MNRKKLLKFLRKNYFIVVILFCIFFVGGVIVSKSLFSKPTYVYVKVKVGQGLWWANTAKPPIWYVNSINVGDASLNLLGQEDAKILSKKYYRWYGGDQFDIYLTILVKVGLNKKTGEYSFDRSALSVGSPIDIQFPKEEVTGTVIALSRQPFEEKLVEKVIYLSKRGAQPWELDAIKIGDYFFNGKDRIFEVLDKSGIELTNLTWDSFGNNTQNITENSKYITVKAKIKVQQVNGQWILGEDQVITAGRVLNISTPNFVFDSYTVSRIE